VSLTLLAGPANSGKVASLLDRYLAVLDQDPVLIVPNRPDVDRIERDLLRKAPALVGGSIATFADLFERLARSNGRSRPVAGSAQRALVLRNALARAHLNGLGPSSRFQGFSESLVQAYLASDTWIHGIFALEQGFIFTAMILSAATVGILERRFRVAALWCLAAAALSALGLMHSYVWTPADTVVSLTPAWPWVAGYAIMAAIFFLAPWITVEGEGH